MVDIEVDGLDEVVRKLEHLGAKYPDRAEEILKDNAKEFRKDLTRKMRSVIKKNKAGKKSLRRVGTYKIYPVRGYNLNTEIDIGAVAPHFHLFERGHNQTGRDGKTIVGYVEGRYVMRDTIEDYRAKYPKVVESRVNRILKEEGLT